MNNRFVRQLLPVLLIACLAGTSQAQLKVVYPSGGQTFTVGSSLTIQWSGIPASATVRLEYTTNSGTSWNIINSAATGLQYKWTNIPNTVSPNCLIRVTYSQAVSGILYLVGASTLNAEFSPDGNSVIGSGEDGNTYIWDSHSTTITHKFLTQSLSAVPSGYSGNWWATWAPDGKTFASVSPEGEKPPDSSYPGVHNIVRTWDANSGVKLREWVVPHEVNGDFSNGMCRFSPDGSKVAASGNDSIVVFSNTTGATISHGEGYCYRTSTFSGCNPTAFLDWSFDGSRILSAGAINFDSVAKYIANDPLTGALLQPYRFKALTPYSLLTQNLNYSPDAKRFVAVTHDTLVRIWDAQTGAILFAKRADSLGTGCAAYSHDGRFIATVGVDSLGINAETVRLWNASDFSFVKDVGRTGGLTQSLSWSPDDSRIAVSSPQGATIFQAASASIQTAVSDSSWSIIQSSGATIHVRIPDFSGSVNDVVSVPLVIDDPNGALAAGATTVNATVMYNATMLDLQGHPAGARLGGTRLDMLNNLTINPNDSVLTMLQFRVALGNDSVTNMIVGGNTNSPTVVTLSQNGVFTLLNVCTQGGPRLINPNDSTNFTIVSPNPTSGGLMIDLSVAEVGNTRLSLMDCLGRVIRTLVDGPQPLGHQLLRVGAAELSSGKYFLVLQSPTLHSLKQVEVLR